MNEQWPHSQTKGFFAEMLNVTIGLAINPLEGFIEKTAEGGCGRGCTGKPRLHVS